MIIDYQLNIIVCLVIEGKLAMISSTTMSNTRVGRPTDQPTDGRTDGRTDRPTDGVTDDSVIEIYLLILDVYL